REGAPVALRRPRFPPPARPRSPPELSPLCPEPGGPPARRRHTSEFKAKSKRLGILLGLSDAWWMMLHVETANDPRPRPTLAAHAWWPRVRAVRAALLEALRARGPQPAEEAAEHPVSEAP